MHAPPRDAREGEPFPHLLPPEHVAHDVPYLGKEGGAALEDHVVDLVPGDAVPGAEFVEQGVEKLPHARVEPLPGENVVQDVVVQRAERLVPEGEVALAPGAREQLHALGLPPERHLPLGPVVQRRGHEPLQNPAVDVVAAELDGLLRQDLCPPGLHRPGALRPDHGGLHRSAPEIKGHQGGGSSDGPPRSRARPRRVRRACGTRSPVGLPRRRAQTRSHQPCRFRLRTIACSSARYVS